MVFKDNVQQTTRGFSGGMPSRSYTRVDEHKIKPYELRHLKTHQCVLVHCERGFKRTILASLETGRQNLLMVQRVLVLTQGSHHDRSSGAGDDLLNS